MKDVWLITNWQAIQWVRDPTPVSKLNNFQPFQCDFSVSFYNTFFVTWLVQNNVAYFIEVDFLFAWLLENYLNCPGVKYILCLLPLKVSTKLIAYLEWCFWPSCICVNIFKSLQLVAFFIFIQSKIWVSKKLIH